MRTRNGLLAVIAGATLSGCVNGSDPTGPSALGSPPLILSGPAVVAPDFPLLTGQWRASGTSVFRNIDTGNRLNWGGCSGSLTITQDGERFTGPLGTQGRGWNSDRFCTASGTFTGELSRGAEVIARARLEGNFQNWPRPAVTPSCELVAAGDGIWTGTVTGDAIQLEVRDTLRCPANVDGGQMGIPMANFERTVSLTFHR